MTAVPSSAGAGFVLAATALFLTRRPQQIVMKRDARLIPAASALVVLGLLGAAGAGWAISQAGFRPTVPLLAAIPAGALFIWFDRRQAARETVAEFAGAAFFAAFPAAMAIAAGGSPGLATTLSAFALVRAVTSILPIRSWLRRRKGHAISPIPTTVALLAACGAFALFAGRSGWWIPVLWTLIFATLACWLLSPGAPAWTAKRLGIMQMLIGGFAMITSGISFH